MDRTNFVDGPILTASWLNRLQDKAESALEDQSKTLLAGEIVAGLGLTIAGAAGTISAGLAYDDQGRPIPADQALTVALDDLDRPTGADWLWAAVWVRAAVHRSGSVHDLDNVAYDLYLDDGAEAGIDLGASAATKQAAVRPVLAAGKVLVADVAVDADTAWADLAIDTSRRTELSRDAGAIDRALTAVQTALAALQATVERIKTSIPGEPDLSGLATTVQLVALTGIVNAAKATAEAAVTQAQLAAATPDATTTERGLVELATDAEVLAGADAERAVTPRGLAGLTASETRAGIVRLASRSEVQETAAPAGTDFSRAVSIGRLRKDLTATPARRGLVEMATNVEAQAGADTQRAVTAAGMRAHGDARYRDVVLSSAPVLGVVNLSEPVAGFRWIRALAADGSAKDSPLPLATAWKPETFLYSCRLHLLSTINLTTGARTEMRRGTQVILPDNMAQSGDVLYLLGGNSLNSINLNEPGFIIRKWMTPVHIRGKFGLTAVNGTLYTIAKALGGDIHKLWSINPTTRAMAEIGVVGRDMAASTRDSVAMATIGSTVYALDAKADTVLTIDLATGRGTPLPRSLGASISGTSGMFVIGTTLYISAASRLYTVDTNTGVAARVRSGGLLSEASNLNLQGAVAPGRFPEPGAKVFADGPRSVICRVPGVTHIIGVR